MRQRRDGGNQRRNNKQCREWPRNRAAKQRDERAACRVEDRRGGLGHMATLRFLSPLIKPDMPISASGFPTSFIVRHTEKALAASVLCAGLSSFALRYSFLCRVRIVSG